MAALAAGERAAGESTDDATSQVKIREAFASPDNLQNCLGFLRTYAADRKAQAACTVVPAHQIAYPQVYTVMALLTAMHAAACLTYDSLTDPYSEESLFIRFCGASLGLMLGSLAL